MINSFDIRLFKVQFDAGGNFEVDFGYTPPVDVYDGTYEVTPSSEEQQLLTANKTLESNVVIHPIPSNYGLITWNGAVLTVS